MTNEELSQALRALAEEFGAEYSTDYSARGHEHRLKIGDTTARVSYYKTHASWYVDAGLQDSSGSWLDYAGSLYVERAGTILIWLRVKLLELTREKREQEFDDLMHELLVAYDVFAEELYDGPTDPGLSERMSRLVDAKRQQLRKLAFGGE